MAIQLLVAHTGRRLQVDDSHFASLDDFKAYASRHSSIPVQCIIALTAQGKPLKFQSLPVEKEIYLYDNRITQPASPGASLPLKIDVPLPQRFTVSSPPNAIDDTWSLQSWQQLFKTRRTWAQKIVEDCVQMEEATKERYGEMDVMMRCLDAAVANLESVVQALEPKYANFKAWAAGAQADYGSLVTGWEQYFSLSRNITISSAMGRFMMGRDVAGTSKGRPARQSTLEDLIDLEAARRAGRLAPTALRNFNTRIAEVEKAASRLFREGDNLFREFERVVARSALSHEGESVQLLQDIDAVAKKVDTDCQTTLEYSNSTRDVLQASKIASNHTERLLPSIRNRALEMDGMLRYATEARNSLAAESVDFMRNITDITSLSSTVKSQLGAVNQEEELATFDYLRLIQQVPYVYASFVAEAIKRREWFEKVKADSTALANEMALFQDEEAKRRRKWHKSVGNAFGPETPAADSTAPGLEVNLLGEEEQWPIMTRKDLEDFYEFVQRQKADPKLIGDIGKMISDLNNPTKQQSKRLKAFKNGSVHEAALGRSGLMIRGDDDLLRTLQDDKSRLESKVKTAESRIRRLEDLLHRQSQASRPTLGNLFQGPSQQLSDRNESTVSVKSPRASEDRRRSSDGADLLVQRIQQLESELDTARERSAVFERDLSVRTTQNNDMKGLMEEANSTKKDLMENMEALKREFMEERKSLEDEIKRLQARLEDTEDEIEHFGESREHEKASYDERVRDLELQVQKLTDEKNDVALKAGGQVDFLRKEARLQRERVESLDTQLLASQDEAKALARQLEDANEAGETKLRALRDVHANLSPDSMVPLDLNELVDAVTSISGDLVTKLQVANGDASLLRSELQIAQNVAKDLGDEIVATRQKLSDEEVSAMHLRETLAEARARAAALEGELADGREQVNELRIRIADGETGSESLRKRLEDSEKRITSMTEDLATRQSQVGSQEEELRLFQDRFHETQARLTELSGRLEARTGRAKDLTQRLYSQNDRLCRLLERLGFSFTRHGSSMVIQKVPRSERSPQNATDSSDPGSSLRRSGTLGSRVLGDSGDLELLYWMNSSDAEVEAERYEVFMSALGFFDMDAFSEAIYRRVKDVEHMARKLQRDSRAYREKAHALQKEAHDKIAFKNFKEGDLALFLPTRNQATGAWAAFNVGFPHYFLREQEVHRLRSREWLVARISGIQERVVDLSKSLRQRSAAGKDGVAGTGLGASAGAETDSINEEENDNPFDLSDGLRWYLIDAHEDKPGAPSTPGLAKSTVAANNVEAMADMHTHARSSSGKTLLGGSLAGRGAGSSGIEGVSKTLSKSLESRRSSTGSRKALPFAVGVGARVRDNAMASETNSLRAAAAETPVATSPTQHHGNVHTTAPAVVSQSVAPLDGQETNSAAAQDHGRPQQEEPQHDQHREQNQQGTPEGRSRRPAQREVSAGSIDSPSKKSVVWDPLWSLDLSYESGRKGK